jgi:hypothetical protein
MTDLSQLTDAFGTLATATQAALAAVQTRPAGSVFTIRPSGGDDTAAVQAVFDTLTNGSTLRASGTFLLSGAGITISAASREAFTFDAGGAIFEYSGTGTAITFADLHFSDIKIGSVRATGAAITSSTAVGVSCRAAWAQISLHVENFTGGTGLVLTVSNNNNLFRYIKTTNCKVGVTTSGDGNHNAWLYLDYRCEEASGVTDGSAFQATGTGTYLQNDIQFMNCSWNRLTGDFTLFDFAEFNWEMTVRNIGLESRSSGITWLGRMYTVDAPDHRDGVVRVGHILNSQVGDQFYGMGSSLVKGTAVNFTHIGCSGAANAEPYWEPAAASFSAYNWKTPTNVSDGRITTTALSITAGAGFASLQLVHADIIHPAQGSSADTSMAIKSNTAGVRVLLFLNQRNVAGDEMGSGDGDKWSFVVETANVWYWFRIAQPGVVRYLTAKGHLQVTVVDDNVVDATNLRISELGGWFATNKPHD